MRANWTVSRLENVIVPSGTIDPTKTPTKKFKYVDVSSVSNETFKIVHPLEILGSEAPSRARRKIKSNDVIFATIRPTLRRIAIVTPDLDGQVCSTGYFVFRTKPDLHHKFLFYYLLTDQFSEKMGALQTGASYPAVNDKQVRNQQIAFPLLPEQKRIVAILDKAFEGIATAISSATKNLANASELFNSYLKAVFVQRGEEWSEKPLGQICKNLDSRRVPITKSDRIAGDVPYYGASGIVDHVTGHLFDEDILLISEDGANLLARTYPIAFSVSGKSWVNNHAHVVRFERPETQKLVEFYLNHISVAPFVSGMAQPKLNQKSLNSIPIPVPPPTEQVRIVETAAMLQASVRRLEEIYQQKLESLAELKQTILRKAFAGELTAQSAQAVQEAAE